MIIVQTPLEIEHNPGVPSDAPILILPLSHILQSTISLIDSSHRTPHPAPSNPSISQSQIIHPPIPFGRQTHSCIKEFASEDYHPIMWNVDPTANHQNISDNSTCGNPPKPLLQSMLPDAQSINPEPLSISSNHPQPHSPSVSQPSSHPLGIHNPPIIRGSIRRFSPPFKPFGSHQRQTDEESVVSLDSPTILPSMLATDLASNQFRSSSSSDVIVLSATQPHPLAMMASGSKPKRSESLFATLGGDLTEVEGPADEVLKQFTMNSDIEFQDSPSLKRPRRKGDKSTRYRDHNPSNKQSCVSDPSMNSNPSRTVAFTQSSKPSRNSTRSITNHEPDSHALPEQSSDNDDDIEMTIAPRPKQFSNGHPTAGRAATARRALFNAAINGLSLDSENPPEPIPSSSNSKIISPRLCSPRQHSPNTPTSPTCLPGSGSSTNGDDQNGHSTTEAHENNAGVETKKLRTKSSVASSRPKRPKPPASPTDPSAPPDTPPLSNSTCKNEVKRRIATLLPATEPDEFGQYESSTCHQCRVKTTRPKMICDQSQDPNCVVRVCHTCLMVRTVYDDMPDLRPPIFQFVPGGTMLCVKCRDICPCASCRRRRGEKEQCRRGLGSGLKGFYGMTAEEREQAFTRKKEKQEAARLKKESRPQSERKTPATYRREVTSTRSNYDDDDHERLQHWAPLPVFPPLPKRRKKKRKRLEIMEGVRVESQASDTDSDTSCSDSDSDTCDDTDSDSRSLSSVSSFQSTNRPHVVLGSVPFQLPLSSNTRSTVPLLTKRWRSNFSRSLKEDGSDFSNLIYPASNRKSHGDKAPVVWIKNGAMVQARKPPTTEFMQRLAEELKGRSTTDPNTLVAIKDSTISSNSHPRSAPFVDDEGYQSNKLPDPSDSFMDQDNVVAVLKPSFQMETQPPNYSLNSKLCPPSESAVNSELVSKPTATNHSQTLSLVDENHSKAACSRPMESLQCPLEALDIPLASHSQKCHLFTPGNFSKPMPLGEQLGMCSESLNSTPPPLMEGSLDQGEFTDIGIKSFRTLDATNTISLRSNANEFEPGSSPVDHQTYLAGLTDEQLSAVLKEGNYVMAKRGFLPSSINPNGLSKFSDDHQDHHQFTTGISPELISASLPLGVEQERDQIGKTLSEGDPSSSSAPLPADLSEEDQEARAIEAASWAAVWGATDGAGGFVITNPVNANQDSTEESQAMEIDEANQRITKTSTGDHDNTNETNSAGVVMVNGHLNHHLDGSSAGSSHWVHHPSGADRELFLRAMKSRVGDEWLTDVMPLDSC